jgi:hypothetical protein
VHGAAGMITSHHGRALLLRVQAAYRWLGLEPVDICWHRYAEISSPGALDQLDRAEALELAADRSYQAILPSDEAGAELGALGGTRTPNRR